MTHWLLNIIGIALGVMLLGVFVLAWLFAEGAFDLGKEYKTKEKR